MKTHALLQNFVQLVKYQSHEILKKKLPLKKSSAKSRETSIYTAIEQNIPMVDKYTLRSQSNKRTTSKRPFPALKKLLSFEIRKEIRVKATAVTNFGDPRCR